MRERLFARLVACCIASGPGVVASESGGEMPLAGQLASVYEPGSVLVLGELHGTKETPGFVFAVVDELARTSDVVLGLEIPRQEQDRIDAFLASDGGVDARAALVAGTFWQRPVERSDGRRSEAAVGLLDAIRRRSGENAVRVVALDDERFFDDGADRSAGLAARIVELRRQSGTGAVVVLVGNYHARLSAPTDVWSDGERLLTPPVPTAARIDGVPLTTVEVAACEGGFWSCSASDRACGIVALTARCDGSDAPKLDELDWQRSGYHLRVVLPRLTPSPPAR